MCVSRASFSAGQYSGEFFAGGLLLIGVGIDLGLERKGRVAVAESISHNLWALTVLDEQ